MKSENISHPNTLRAWKDFDLTATVNCFHVCLKSETSLSQEPEKLFKDKAPTAADDCSHRKWSVCGTRCRWMEPRSKESSSFYALAVPASWVCSAFLWPGQGLRPPNGYGSCKARKGQLGIFARVWKLYMRFCVGHGTVKRNCTLQLNSAQPLPCLPATLLFPFPDMRWLGSAVASGWGWQPVAVRRRKLRPWCLDFARDPAARAATCVSLCSEKMGCYCPPKHLFNLLYVHQSKPFAIARLPLPSLTCAISKLYSSFQQRRAG